MKNPKKSPVYFELQIQGMNGTFGLAALSTMCELQVICDFECTLEPVVASEGFE